MFSSAQHRTNNPVLRHDVGAAVWHGMWTHLGRPGGSWEFLLQTLCVRLANKTAKTTRAGR